jgi:Glycosyl hydrolase family 81 N-terminal domain
MKFIILLLLAAVCCSVVTTLVVGQQQQQQQQQQWRSVASSPMANWSPQFSSSGQTHGQALGSYWGGNTNSRPYPTNEFWSMLTLGSGSNPIKTYPYLFKANGNNGLSMCYPGRTPTQGYIVETYLDNLMIGASEGFNGRQLVDYRCVCVCVCVCVCDAVLCWFCC